MFSEASVILFGGGGAGGGLPTRGLCTSDIWWQPLLPSVHILLECILVFWCCKTRQISFPGRNDSAAQPCLANNCAIEQTPFREVRYQQCYIDELTDPRGCKRRTPLLSVQFLSLIVVIDGGAEGELANRVNFNFFLIDADWTTRLPLHRQVQSISCSFRQKCWQMKGWLRNAG